MTKKTLLHAIEPEDIEGMLPPEKVGNPSRAANFAIDQSHMEEFATDEEAPGEVSCAKPPKGTFFTVLPETGKPWKNRRFYFMLEVPGRDPYLVSPDIARLKKDEDTIRPVLLVRYVTMAGDEGLWPLKLDVGERKSNPWNKSAMTALKVADEHKWIRLLSGKGQYRYTISPKTFDQTPPRPSDRSYDDMVDATFGDRMVDSLDHEIWEILTSGSDK